jgi:hypothetical protein
MEQCDARHSSVSEIGNLTEIWLKFYWCTITVGSFTWCYWSSVSWSIHLMSLVIRQLEHLPNVIGNPSPECSNHLQLAFSWTNQVVSELRDRRLDFTRNLYGQEIQLLQGLSQHLLRTRLLRRRATPLAVEGDHSSWTAWQICRSGLLVIMCRICWYPQDIRQVCRAVSLRNVYWYW